MNHQQLRKKYSRIVYDEIFTVETELQNMAANIEKADLKSLRKLSYEQLKSLRHQLCVLSNQVKQVNRTIQDISCPGWMGCVVIQTDEKVDVYVPTRLLNQ